MVFLDAAQRENLSTALVVARAWAVASGNDPTAVAERVAFCAWTESRGYVYANDGRNTSNSPGFTSGTAATLRRSLNLPHDLTGSNGRSTGMYQQTSEDVGGGWGDMAGTMDPAISTARLLARLVITDNPVYAGTLLTSTGTRRVAVTLSSPIAADVLRVQQPLADEAESSNYNAAQVAIAREIVAQLSPSPATGASDNVLDGILMADQAALDAFAAQIAVATLTKPIRSQSETLATMLTAVVTGLDELPVRIWTKGITSDGPGGHANELLSALVANTKALASKVDSLAAKVDALGAALDQR